MQPKSEPQPSVTLRGNEARVARTRGRIFDAVVECLDEAGYSETSINRVQTRAGVSRGALTHHFPSKEEMMVKTLERLLDPVRGSAGGTGGEAGGDASLIRRAGSQADIAADMSRLWAQVINTREGRALMEILVASRTDPALRSRITPSLWAYNDEFNRNIARLYEAASGTDDDLALLWSICRSFMRGLHSQAPYERDPQSIARMVELFGRIMAPHLRPKPDPE
jgi:AcrR family transcriptional regulator